MLNQPSTKCDRCRLAKKKCVASSTDGNQCLRCQSLNHKCPGRPSEAIISASITADETDREGLDEAAGVPAASQLASDIAPHNSDHVRSERISFVNKEKVLPRFRDLSIAEDQKPKSESFSVAQKKIAVGNAPSLAKRNKGDLREAKLNDLKRFAATFTLKSPVPKDLLPILAKDPARQKQILQEREAHLETLASKKIANGAASSTRLPAIAETWAQSTEDAHSFLGSRVVKKRPEKLDMVDNFDVIKLLRDNVKEDSSQHPNDPARACMTNGGIPNVFRANPFWTVPSKEQQVKPWQTRYDDIFQQESHAFSHKLFEVDAEYLGAEPSARTKPQNGRSALPIPRDASANSHLGDGRTPSFFPAARAVSNSSSTHPSFATSNPGGTQLSEAYSSLASSVSPSPRPPYMLDASLHYGAYVSPSYTIFDRAQPFAPTHNHTPASFPGTFPTYKSNIKACLEFYLSPAYLDSDVVIRRFMNSQGFIPVSKLATLPMLKFWLDSLSFRFWSLLSDAACLSSKLRIVFDMDHRQHIRPATGWERYVLPSSQRDPSVQITRPTSYLDLRPLHPEAPRDPVLTPLHQPLPTDLGSPAVLLRDGTNEPRHTPASISTGLYGLSNGATDRPRSRVDGKQYPWDAETRNYASSSNRWTSGIGENTSDTEESKYFPEYDRFDTTSPVTQADRLSTHQSGPPMGTFWPSYTYDANPALTARPAPLAPYTSHHMFGSTTISGNARAVLGSVHNVYNHAAPEVIQEAVEKALSLLTEQGVLPKAPMQKDRDEVAHWVRQTFEAQMYATTIWDGESVIVPPSIGTSMAPLESLQEASGSPTFTAMDTAASPSFPLYPEASPELRHTVMR